MKKLLIVIIGLMALLPSQIFAFNIKSEHAILYNLNEDSVLYEVKPNEKVAIASLTKIMTALVVVENVKNLDAEFVMTKDMYKTLIEENASVAGFQIGETVTYRELLYGLLLPSGAEAAQGLAIKTSGSIEKFVVLMNKKAKELGLKNTSFANPTGLDHKDNYSTVSDVAILLKYALKNKDFKDFNKIKSKSIDFVITQENCKILMCIELDDPTHEQKKRIERDNFINKLFEDLQIKYLRIPVQNFYNMDELENKIKESL